MGKKKYTAVFTLAVLHSLKNYKVLVGLSFLLITCLLIFAHLWEIVAAKAGASNLNPDQLLWYIALNEWILFSIPAVHEDMEQDLRSGRLAYLLPRPISYPLSVFFESLGILCVNLASLGCVTFIFSWLWIGTFPFDFWGFLSMTALGILAGCVGILCSMIVGISAFWLQEVSPFNWIMEKMLFALGGLMVPLFVYPVWLQKIAHFTPFPAILGDRSALVMHFSLGNVLHIGLILVSWGIFGALCLVFLYRRGLKILNVSGG